MSTVKARRVGLTQERVLREALALVDGEGVGALTMRRLADRLGVEAPSLYNHVPNKQALADGVLALLIDEATDYRAGVPWLERIRRSLLAYREVMRAHPQAFLLVQSASAESPATWRSAEELLAAMEEGGLGPAAQRKWWILLGSFVNGFLLQELGTGASSPVTDAVRRERPRLASFMDKVAEEGVDAHFLSGLDLLLDSMVLEAR